MASDSIVAKSAADMDCERAIEIIKLSPISTDDFCKALDLLRPIREKSVAVNVALAKISQAHAYKSVLLAEYDNWCAKMSIDARDPSNAILWALQVKAADMLGGKC